MTYSAISFVAFEVLTAANMNILGTNDAHFYSFLGDNLAWQSWTPTWTNLSVGNGTVVAKYGKVGRIVTARLRVTFGSTTSISGAAIFTLPVTAASEYSVSGSLGHYVGNAYVEDAGTAGYVGAFKIENSTSSGKLVIHGAAGTWLNNNDTNSTSPFTWGSGDYFGGTLVYESAS